MRLEDALKKAGFVGVLPLSGEVWWGDKAIHLGQRLCLRLMVFLAKNRWPY